MVVENRSLKYPFGSASCLPQKEWHGTCVLTAGYEFCFCGAGWGWGHRIDGTCCVDESRWKGRGVEVFGKVVASYRYFWKNCKDGMAGVKFKRVNHREGSGKPSWQVRDTCVIRETVSMQPHHSAV